jgi:uncharacterized membrane protein YgcG
MRNLKLFLLIVFTLTLCSCESGCDTRHHAKLYRLKNHHIVMQDDQGKWYAYTKNGLDIDVDIPTWNPRGEMVLPQGGRWTAATQEEEEEVSEATNVENTTVDEATSEDGASSPDGAGDVGGDSGGADGGSGGDGGGGDGGGGDGD